MAGGGRLSSRSRLALLLACGMMAGCAGDLESAEARLDCAGLAQEYDNNEQATARIEGVIAGNRGHNQAVT
jgi:hypothetical protein